MRKILLLGFIVWSFQTFAQTDSISISAEEPDSIDVKYDRTYKLFVQKNNREIKHLFKLDLYGARLLKPALAYEQKISKSFSTETYLYLTYADLKYVNDDSTYFYEVSHFSNSNTHSFSVGGYQMLKYYHNLHRRELLGINTNGFSGNYFAIKLSANYTWMNFYNKNQNSSPNSSPKNKYYIIPGVAYGIQRRIGNIGYVEPSLTLNFFPDSMSNSEYPWLLGLEMGFTLKVGFAIESISSLRNMLKE